MTTEQKKEIEKKVWEALKERSTQLIENGFTILPEGERKPNLMCYNESLSIEDINYDAIFGIKEVINYNKSLAIKSEPIYTKISFQFIEIIERPDLKGYVGIKVCYYGE